MRAAALAQVLDAQAARKGLKREIDFVLGERVNDQIFFLTRDRSGEAAPVPVASELAQPMRRALAGESGSTVGPSLMGPRARRVHAGGVARSRRGDEDGFDRRSEHHS